MEPIICPICDVEMSHDHNCLHSNISNFSLELELLGLSFALEADKHFESIEPPVPAPAPVPEPSPKSSKGSKNSYVFGRSNYLTSVPLFLRI